MEMYKKQTHFLASLQDPCILSWQINLLDLKKKKKNSPSVIWFVSEADWIPAECKLWQSDKNLQTHSSCSLHLTGVMWSQPTSGWASCMVWIFWSCPPPGSPTYVLPFFCFPSVNSTILSLANLLWHGSCRLIALWCPGQFLSTNLAVNGPLLYPSAARYWALGRKKHSVSHFFFLLELT